MVNQVTKERMRNMNLAYFHPSYDLEVELVESMKLLLYADAHSALKQINQLEQPIYCSNSLRSKKISLIAWCAVFSNALKDTGIPYEAILAFRNQLIINIDEESNHSKLIGYEFNILDQTIKFLLRHKVSNFNYPVANIVQYIYEHIYAAIHVSELAEAYHMNGDYLTKLFKAETGQPISSFIMKHKINVAKKHLRFNQKSIREIADMLSFCNGGYFTKQFKKHTGLAPLDYKRSLTI